MRPLLVTLRLATIATVLLPEQVFACLPFDCNLDELLQALGEPVVHLLIFLQRMHDCWIDHDCIVVDVEPGPALEPAEGRGLHSDHFELPGPLLFPVDLEVVVDEEVWMSMPLASQLRGE